MDTIVPGALAAFAVDCSIFPLDTIKSRVQAADYASRFPNGRGLYQGLWQGFGPVVVATLPSAALFFTTYEHAKVLLTTPDRLPVWGAYVAADTSGRAVALGHAASSALAELASCAVLTPAETIKQRMQVAVGGAASSSAHKMPSLALGSIWRGYWALAGRNLPFTALQFPLYEQFRGVLAERVGLRPRRAAAGWDRAAHQDRQLQEPDVTTGDEARRRAYNAVRQRPPSSTAATTPQQEDGGDGAAAHYAKAGAVSGLSAAGAGAISALVTTPLDLVKTRIMLDSSSSSSSGKHRKSAPGMLRDILRTEGVRGVMRGGALRCAWTALGAGVYLGSYEAGREWWGDAGREQYESVKEKVSDEVLEPRR